MKRLPTIHFIKGKHEVTVSPEDTLWGFIGCSFIFLFVLIVFVPSILTGKISVKRVKE